MIVAKKIAMNFCRSISTTGSYVFLDVLAFEFILWLTAWTEEVDNIEPKIEKEPDVLLF